eukprot:6180894-Pleurochrysis_carterae.AAC.1
MSAVEAKHIRRVLKCNSQFFEMHATFCEGARSVPDGTPKRFKMHTALRQCAHRNSSSSMLRLVMKHATLRQDARHITSRRMPHYVKMHATFR